MSSRKVAWSLSCAAILLALLTGCGSSSSPTAHEPASAVPTQSASDTAKNFAEPTGPSKRKVADYAREVEKQMTATFGDMNGLYQDIRVEPDYPSGITYVYVLASKAPAGAPARLATQLPILQATFTTDVVPELKGLGITHPTATFEYRNPDESVVWSKTFGPA